MTSNATQLLTNINLNDLNSSYKLSQFFTQLPSYKKYFNNENKSKPPQSPQQQSNTNNNSRKRKYSSSISDNIICSKLSTFVYQQNLTGSFFVNNFTISDFQNMTELISTENNNDYIWIWNILQFIIQNNSKKTIRNDNKKLEWINSLWIKHQILMDQQIEYTQNNVVLSQNEITCNDKKCESVNKCKSLKRLIMALHFYQSVLSDNQDGISQYFAKYKHILTDYQHVISQHLTFVSYKEKIENMQIIKDKVAFYIKCDANQCKSCKKRDNGEIKNSPVMMDNLIEDDLQNDEIFCGELLDVIHCCFVHDGLKMDGLNDIITMESPDEKENEIVEMNIIQHEMDKEKESIKESITEKFFKRVKVNEKRKDCNPCIFGCFICL